MTSRGKRGTGERVLESKHVIGLFLLMLLFSGVFFSLGYVMGRNQYEGQVRAESNVASRSNPGYMPSNIIPSKKIVNDPATEDDPDPATSSSSPVWNLASKTSSNADHLEAPPVPEVAVDTTSKSVSSKSKMQTQPIAVHSTAKNGKTSLSAPAIASGAYVIQVAALLKQDDAVAIAGSLQKKHYAVYVQSPQKDKYYRVQVGPFKDQKSADAAKKGLEGEGFKAFYVKH
jgi:cell division septation protein DedD